MNTCTNCNKSFKDLRISVELLLNIKTIREGNEELVQNSQIMNKELLCPECFGLFSELLENYSKEK